MLEQFRDFGQCTEAAERQALERLALSAKPTRPDIEFALGLANQTNKLLAKHTTAIRNGGKASEAGVDRVVRVTLAAYRYLRDHRDRAGFSALALEKTLSNLTIACTNAHLGLRIWEGLMLLRALLLEHAKAHIACAGAGQNVSGRSVRKPAPRLGRGASRQKASAESIARGIRRLSIKDPAEPQPCGPTQFPIRYCQSDLGFNGLVMTLLCNILRVLSQSPAAEQTRRAAESLALRQNSALEWCLRVRDMDPDSVEPFLGVCFRAYYALGGSSDRYSLDIRRLSITALAKTKTCDLRELLKYASRAAIRAQATLTLDSNDTAAYDPICRYYSQIIELVRMQLQSAALSPELVEFSFHAALVRRRAGDLQGSLAACRLSASGAVAKLVSEMLAVECLVRATLDTGRTCPEVEPLCGRAMDALVDAALDADTRHTLAEWNALAKCADIIRKGAKGIQAELRQGTAEAQSCGVCNALVSVLDATSRIYDIYISRGAAAKAEETGGTNVATLLSHGAEVSLLLIQLVFQSQDECKAVQDRITSHSDRVIALRIGTDSSSEHLRNHSTVFFNHGAGLYQLKLYRQAASTIGMAIRSLVLWCSQAVERGQPIESAFGQLCKRFEVAAMAHQSGGSFEQAAKMYGRAVAWIIEQCVSSVSGAIYTGDTERLPLPPSSSKWHSVEEAARLSQFVDRYVRMCAGRLAKDPSISEARLSLQNHADIDSSELAIRGWLYEIEAFFWRPYVTPSTPFAAQVQKARLQQAMEAYESCAPLGYARCLVDLAKAERDQSNGDALDDRIFAALEVSKGQPDENIYVVGVIAECYAWRTVVHIERESRDTKDLAVCTRLWTLMGSLLGTQLDPGFLRDVVALIMQVAELLMSRRMYTSGATILQIALRICSTCEDCDQSWAPQTMECLVGLGMACLLRGDPNAGGVYFRDAASRYSAGVLPVHVEVSSKIAYASFQLACGDLDGGSLTMSQARKLAQDSLDAVSDPRSALSKRSSVKPDTLVLLAKASRAYSSLALKQGALADSIDLGIHSYRILNSLLKSLSTAHKRALRSQLHDSIGGSDEDPFSDPKPSTDADDNGGNDEKSDAEFIAFSGNWELQRLLIDVLVHLAEVHSIRGSVKEVEYFLKKALDLSMQLQAPYQEEHLRLREADILSRKSLWSECADVLQRFRGDSETDTGSVSERGSLDVVNALVTEGDSWRRCGNHRRAHAAYTQAAGLVAKMGDPDVAANTQPAVKDATPRLLRILDQASQAEIKHSPADEVSGDGSIPVPLSIIREDISIRQQLLQALGELAKEAGEQSGPQEDTETASRSIDQQPDHMLVQCKLAFVELQRALAAEDSWGLVLESTLMLPGLRHSRVQRLRKGTTKALVKGQLADLDALLTRTAEVAITVGSAHVVHETSHLLALVSMMRTAFGLMPASSSGGSTDDAAIVARVIDDCRSITVVRETVDALRRRGERVPADLTAWPQDAVLRATQDSGSAGCPSPTRLSAGSMGSPLLMGRGPESGLLAGAAPNSTETAEPSVTARMEQAVSGKDVVAGWTAAAREQPLSDALPENWTVCGLSVDHARNVLLVTRYSPGQCPVVFCLPMRAVDAGSLQESDTTASSKSVFDDAYQKLQAIIAASDRTMKTGSTCSTESEKRAWWELRSSLDRQLGALLTSIEDEWLGGFRYVLQPTTVLCGSDTTALRGCIEKTIASCVPKAFVAKAKALNLADEPCMLALCVARRKRLEPAPDSAASDDSSTAENDWLDVCSLLWDIYFFQGAAPRSTDDLLGSFAKTLAAAISPIIEAQDREPPTSNAATSEGGRPHLILVPDKHAQQIPWECLPCLRDIPISRVPSVSFLLERILAMKSGRSAWASRTSNGSGGLDSFMASSPCLRPLPAFGRGLSGNGRLSPDLALQQPLSLSLDSGDEDCSSSLGTQVSGDRVFYVLNPEGDLHCTQSNFEAFVRGQHEWNGVVGRRPINSECEQGLSSSDIFLYFGHGGAEGYISRSQIRALRRCAVALLFGCSSGQLKLAGEYDALGTATDYLVGGCPALVGNLWDVGDKDIDRFAASMLCLWGLDRYSPEKIAVKLDNNRQVPKPPDSGPVSLAEAVCWARKACRMACLTGAAPVVYGLPIYLTQ
ncbi:separin protein [Coemansia sp. RSA 552]|nr:separin protein [Coemansia sp. RSA 552]